MSKIKVVLLSIAIISLCIFLYPTALNFNLGSKDDVEILLSKALSSKKMSFFSQSLNRYIFNEIQGKKVNYNLLGVEFLSTQELLKSKNDKFHSVDIYFPTHNKASINIYYFRTSIVYHFDYEKKNGSWEETRSDWGRGKFGDWKPFYIYWEIIRLKNPNDMDFENFDIPRDSLK